MNYALTWVHVGNGQRTTYELFVALAICLTATTSYSRSMRYTLGGFWVATVCYTAFGAFDAAALRATLHLPI